MKIFLLQIHLKLFDEFSGKLDYMGVQPIKKFFVTAKHRKLRLTFAKSVLNKLEMYWNNVLFADESKFNIFVFDGKITVWRRKNEELHSKNL